MAEVVRLIGAPATGKTFLRAALAATGAASLGIDDERERGLGGARAWDALRGKLLAESSAVVETSGVSPREASLYRPHDRRLVVLCVADEPTRRGRLIDRQRADAMLARDPGYVDRLLAYTDPDVEPDIWFDTSSAPDTTPIVEAIAAWLGAPT